MDIPKLAEVPGFGTLYNNLPTIATALTMTPTDLARASYVSPHTIKRIWRGDIEGVRFETLIKVLAALGKSFEEVFPFEVDDRYSNPYLVNNAEK